MVPTPDFSVVGKHVLITGGTGGIGGALAKTFLDHGANVIVADITGPKDGIDPRIRYEQLDVRDDAVGAKIRNSTARWLLAFQVTNGLSRKSSQGPRFSLPQRHGILLWSATARKSARFTPSVVRIHSCPSR